MSEIPDGELRKLEERAERIVRKMVVAKIGAVIAKTWMDDLSQVERAELLVELLCAYDLEAGQIRVPERKEKSD